MSFLLKDTLHTGGKKAIKTGQNRYIRTGPAIGLVPGGIKSLPIKTGLITGLKEILLDRTF